VLYKLLKNLAVITFIVSIFSGCFHSEDNSVNTVSLIALGKGYEKKSGDVFTELRTIKYNFSDGRQAEITFLDVKTYSNVSEIPDKYNYSGDIVSPYLLETSISDNELDNLNYMTLSGDDIIDDDLESYSNIDYATTIGNDEPENIRVGDKFIFSENAKLFDSITGDEIGFEVTNMEFTVASLEKIKVPAGTFDAVKLQFSISTTKTLNNITDSYSGTGYGWFDVDNAYGLKFLADIDMTLSEKGLIATARSESVLQSYFISQSTVRNKVQSLTIKSTPPKYIQELKQLVLDLKNDIKNI